MSTRLSLWFVFAIGATCGAGSLAVAAPFECYQPQGVERRAILDVESKSVAYDLKQPISLRITKFRVCRSGNSSWAFIDARPHRVDGGVINWEAMNYVNCSHSVQALLKKQPQGSWRILASDVCPSDVPWAAWSRQYGAPPDLFR